MDDRQALETIMDILDIQYLKPKVRDVAEQNEISPLTMVAEMVAMGCHAEQARIDCVKQRKKEKNQKKERNNIYNNNNKEKTVDTLKNLNTRAQSSIPPLEAKRQAKEKAKKKERRVQMPKAWVDARQKETIDVGGNLVSYAESQGYDWYGAKEIFLAFVDYHLAKGSIFKSWDAAWRTWIRNDIKFNGKPATHSPGSVVQSYTPKNTIGELFND